MANVSSLIESDIAQYLARHERKGLLRFITCGSVGNGKSTLIGRLLWESKSVLEDTLATLEHDLKRVGTRDGELDFTLLTDGFNAERGQGITNDVAYRFFSTDRRKFIVADTPAHEQYTRNMATGASTADLAVLLVDATKGILPQTRRHSVIAALLGIRHVVLAVNKMDCVDFSAQAFARIEADYREFAKRIGIAEVVAIPLCAVDGDNVVTPSERTPWYAGPTLMEHLETVAIGEDLESRPFRLPVQWVNRPDATIRGYAGTIVSGAVGPGDAVRILPSGRESRVARVTSAGGDIVRAVANQAVTVTLADEIDVNRGDVIAAASDPVEVAAQFEATLVWMSDAPMLPGRDYLLKIGACTVTATVAPLKYRLNVETLEHAAATKLDLDEIGVVQLELDRPIAFEPYERNRDLGGFVLIDRLSNRTVGAGMLRFALRRSQNVHWQAVDIDRKARAALKGQKPCVLWFTGLSASGKSTIANLVEKRLHAMGRHTYLLDGDNVRHGLNKDLGFTEAARVENIRRVAEVAALMADAGLVVLVAFISPFESERRMARALLPKGEFLEIFVDTPLEVAERRDPKGLYRKARRGEIANFTGVNSPYERPSAPDIVVDGTSGTPGEAAEVVLGALARLGFMAPLPP